MQTRKEILESHIGEKVGVTVHSSNKMIVINPKRGIKYDLVHVTDDYVKLRDNSGLEFYYPLTICLVGVRPKN